MQDLKKIKEGQIDPAAQKNTQIGVYCGMGGTALGILYLIASCVFGIIRAISGSSS
jgi:hypothetical protein